MAAKSRRCSTSPRTRRCGIAAAHPLRRHSSDAAHRWNLEGGSAQTHPLGAGQRPAGQTRPAGFLQHRHDTRADRDHRPVRPPVADRGHLRRNPPSTHGFQAATRPEPLPTPPTSASKPSDNGPTRPLPAPHLPFWAFTASSLSGPVASCRRPPRPRQRHGIERRLSPSPTPSAPCGSLCGSAIFIERPRTSGTCVKSRQNASRVWPWHFASQLNVQSRA